MARRRASALSLVLVIISLAGCAPRNHAAPIRTPPPTTAPAPLPKPTPKRTPSPTGTATRKATTKRPTSTATTVQPARLPQTGGYGPAGSRRWTGNATVALTFDDGPDPVYTTKLLDLLRKNGVKATFCVVGFRVRDHGDLIRRIVAEGHTICNHSWQHLMDLGQRTDEEILRDLRATNNAILKAAPNARIKYFRAPGGNFTPRLVALAKSLGMVSLYWSIDTRDWEFSVYGHGSTMVNHIISTVKEQTRPGSIVLSHDNGKPDTITAYATLLPWLKPRFRLVALPT